MQDINFYVIIFYNVYVIRFNTNNKSHFLNNEYRKEF